MSVIVIQQTSSSASDGGANRSSGLGAAALANAGGTGGFGGFGQRGNMFGSQASSFSNAQTNSPWNGGKSGWNNAGSNNFINSSGGGLQSGQFSFGMVSGSLSSALPIIMNMLGGLSQTDSSSLAMSSSRYV
jgi:hypothetical protein